MESAQLHSDLSTDLEPTSASKLAEHGFSEPQPTSAERGGSRDPRSGTKSTDASSPAPEGVPVPLREPQLRAAGDTALARSFVHRYLANAYEDPTAESWTALGAAQARAALATALRTLGATTDALAAAARAWVGQLNPETFNAFLSAYLVAFGHAARGCCPLNEIEYGDLAADPLFQPHRLADLAAFYRAFGLELAGDATERLDHLSVELEFMSVLAAKEAFALEHHLGDEPLAICRDAQRLFLREHLGRWAPAFGRRLAALDPASPLAALAGLTKLFVESECARFGVAPGSEDLLLRPADEAAETLCAACGVPSLLPGARDAGDPQPVGAGA